MSKKTINEQTSIFEPDEDNRNFIIYSDVNEDFYPRFRPVYDIDIPSDDEIIYEKQISEVTEKQVPEINADTIKNNPTENNRILVFLSKAAPSAIVGIGTGLAMMPIFNHFIKKSEVFGQDVHKNDYTFTISTINTSVVYGVTSIGGMYYFLKSKELEIRNNYDRAMLIIAKVSASCSVLIPLSLLWGIEIENQKVANSQGFDAFVAWATFTSLPLLVSKCMDSCRSVNKMYQNILDVQLDSAGSKFFVYTPTALSLVGRFIAYYAAGNNLTKAIGADDNTSIAAGITSGIVGSLSTSIFEFTALKSLFKKQTENFTFKKFCAAGASILEGAWFSIPVVSIGITATEGWNPFVKALIFTPLFVTSTAAESLNIYEIGENVYDSLTGCCRPTDLEGEQ